jgi:thioredoxin 1
MGVAKEVTDATFDVNVLKSSKPVIVDFWAEWCMPCRKVESVLTQLLTSSDLGEKVDFFKMDIDSNPRVSQAYQVMSVPTITIFKDGQPFTSLSGSRSRAELLRMIETAL